MRLNAPKKIVFIISLILAVLGLLGEVGILAIATGATAFWLALAGFALLALGTLIKGM